MDRFDRIYALHRILSNRHTPISRQELQAKLETSHSSVKRTIDDLRTYLNAPLEYNAELNGYHYAKDGEKPFELPGLWFNSDELFALLTSYNLLLEIQPGLLDEFIQPMLDRIQAMLPKLAKDQESLDWCEVQHRVRILQQGARSIETDRFRQVVAGLIKRKRLKVLYHGRERDALTERMISPQRLVYYRDNWYLDAYCHLREGLRSFALERMHLVFADDSPALEVADAELDTYFGDAYGIFAGPRIAVAKLRFSSHAAKWVADEQWHPEQTLAVLSDGGLELQVPYSDPRELIGEILRYGAEVEVLEPLTLRKSVVQQLTQALERYRPESLS